MPDNAEPMARLVEVASIIVRAVVSQLHASNEPTVSPSERSVIAQVETVFRAGPALQKLAGQAVTIELAAPERPLRTGERAIFFTNGLVYGSHVVLREVAHREANAENEREVVREIEALPAQHLKRRLDTAEIVAVGRIEHVRPSGINEPASFHSPKWMSAELHVREALKGSRREERLAILFPSARDVLWATAPRFQDNQEGILLLHRGVAKWGAPLDALTALDAADFQPIDALQSVRALLRQDR